MFTSPAVLDVVQSHATTRVPELPPIGKFEDVSFGQLESWYSSGMRVSSSFCVCKPGFKPSLLVAAENKKRSRFERLRKPKTSAAPSEGPITDMSFQDLQRLNDTPSGNLLPVLIHYLNEHFQSLRSAWIVDALRECLLTGRHRVKSTNGQAKQPKPPKPKLPSKPKKAKSASAVDLSQRQPVERGAWEERRV